MKRTSRCYRRAEEAGGHDEDDGVMDVKVDLKQKKYTEGWGSSVGEQFMLFTEVFSIMLQVSCSD